MNQAIWDIGDVADYSSKVQSGIDNLIDITDADIVVGGSPKDSVFTVDKVTLYKYRAITGAEDSQQEPILITYSLFGRYSMLDLQTDRSVVRNLLLKGHTVYIVDWGNPNKSDRWLSYDDYVGRYLSDCVDHICGAHNLEKISIFGVCEGGTFAACYAALNPDKVGSLILAVTPVDFHADQASPEPAKRGYLSAMMQKLGRQQLSDMIDAYGCLPGHLSGAVFREMTLMDSLKKYGVDLVDSVSGTKESALNFLRMEKWLLDRPHHPAEAAKQWLIDFYHENKLVLGTFEVNGEAILLQNLCMPVLNIFAKHDHIVPPAASKALRDQVPSDCHYSELELRAGHIGAFVSRNANAAISEAISNWIPALTRAPASTATSQAHSLDQRSA